MICAVTLGSSIDDLFDQKQIAIQKGANIVEYRLDALHDIDFERLKRCLEKSDEPIIFSVRSEWQDEKIELKDIDRKELLENLIDLNPNYIDLEYPHDMSLLSKINANTTPILSMLDFEGMAKIAFDSVLSALKNLDREVIVKIAATPHSVEDLKQLWRWAKSLRKRNIPYNIIGMGELGQLSRIKSKELGNQWMYGQIGENIGEPYVPGMLSIEELKKAFEDEAWHLASFGQLPDSDILKIIYQELLKGAGLEGVYLNLPIMTKPELDQILLWTEDGLFDGVNISSPWQETVLPNLDLKHPSVVQMNSCNCISMTKNGLKGYNTQIEGIKRSLEPYGIKRFKRILIDGTEKPARAVISAFKKISETIVLRANPYSNGTKLFDDFPEITPFGDSYSNDFDLVVNCSKPDQGFENVVMLPPQIIKRAKLIFDPMSKISSPTAIMQRAQDMGKNFLGGWDFFFNTALSSFELWTKRSIPSSSLKPNLFAEYKDKIDFGFMLNY